MKLSDIVVHTKVTIPFFTDKFSDTATILSISKNNDTVSVNSINHGLSVDQSIKVTGVRTKTIISNITTLNGVATATCETTPDLNDIQFVDIQSPEPAYNGRFEITLINSNRLQFKFDVEGTPPPSSGYLTTYENVGFNGTHIVTNVINDDNFEYKLENNNLVSGTGTNMQFLTNTRIFGASTIERVIESFTDSGNPEKVCGYIVLEGSDTSNDRNTNNDSVAERVPGEDFQITLIKLVSFYVMIPISNTVLGLDGIDLAQELERDIYRSLAGYAPESLFVSNDKTYLVPVSSTIYADNGAYIVYLYQFEATERVVDKAENKRKDNSVFIPNSGDTFPNFNTTSFRDIEIKYVNDNEQISKQDKWEVKPCNP